MLLTRGATRGRSHGLQRSTHRSRTSCAKAACSWLLYAAASTCSCAAAPLTACDGLQVHRAPSLPNSGNFGGLDSTQNDGPDRRKEGSLIGHIRC
jgi:hypothetical protein